MAEEIYVNASECYDLNSLFCSEQRDFLVRNNGEQVKVKDLTGKIISLYFSASWCSPCLNFTPSLIEVYNELSSKGDFEVVFISSDGNEKSFERYFSKMPWLAIPHSDKATIESLGEKFSLTGVPHLVILDKDGKVLTDEGVQVIEEYEAQAYPFTKKIIKQLKKEEEAARLNQSLLTLLVYESRDYVISSNEKKVPVSELQGKIVGLYFCVGSDESCIEFTKKLEDVYKKLKDNGEPFEIVLIYLDNDDEQGFNETLSENPWFALPINDKKIKKLARYFDLETVPRLVIIGFDGKTLNDDVAELIDEHGVDAYPFTQERCAEIQKAKLESQTLESILVQGENDFVLDKTGSKVPITELVGKYVLIYFSAQWCSPCLAFMPKLIEAYHEIKSKKSPFEIIFASNDFDESSFDEYYSNMPWLVLPYGDKRISSLSKKFKVPGIPSLVAIGPEGKTITTETRQLIEAHGADAFPFTKDHINNLKEKFEEMANDWPEELESELHEHELLKVRRSNYYCNGCRNLGHSWSFYCEDCDFDLHPKCALKN